MDPITIIAAANAALALFETLAPKVKELMAKGEVPVEQQAQLMERIKRLRGHAEGQFSGPEWEVK